VSKGVWTILREEVRWGEEVQKKRDDLEAKLKKLNLKDKVLEKLLKDRINKEIAEIAKQQGLGTRSRALTLP
jgi:FixJ family two-component response regulator